MRRPSSRIYTSQPLSTFEVRPDGHHHNFSLEYNFPRLSVKSLSVGRKVGVKVDAPRLLWAL